VLKMFFISYLFSFSALAECYVIESPAMTLGPPPCPSIPGSMAKIVDEVIDGDLGSIALTQRRKNFNIKLKKYKAACANTKDEFIKLQCEVILELARGPLW